MLLKRHYDIPPGWEPERSPDGTLLNPLPVTGLTMRHTGTHAEQNFSRRFVDAGLAEGWVSLSRGTLVIHALDGDFTYTVVRMPGSYCCHCDAPLADDPSGALGRAHVEAEHAGIPSPDATNPAGYRVTHVYACVLDAAQHAQWNAQAVAQRMAMGSEKQA